MTTGRITLYIAISVDGFVATEDGGVEWLDEFEGDTEDGGTGGSYADFFAGIDCLVMGARTYEQVLSFGDWPYAEKPTYVLTHRDRLRANDHITFYAGAVEALAADLEDQYQDVWLVGGAEVAQEFLSSNRIDELWLSVIPRLLGSGISLFGDSGGGHELALIESASHPSGIVELRYDVN